MRIGRSWLLAVSLLAGCAGSWRPTVPADLGDGLRDDPQGQRLAYLFQLTGQLALVDNTHRSMTVLVPTDDSWPAGYWACLIAPDHGDEARAVARSHVLLTRWGIHLSSTQALPLFTVDRQVRWLHTREGEVATADGVAVQGAVQPWLNGTLVHVAHLLPVPDGACARAGGVARLDHAPVP